MRLTRVVRCGRFGLAALLVAATTAPAAAQAPACRFTITSKAPAPTLVRSAEMPKLSVLDQPGSPLAIVAADFSKFTLKVGKEQYDSSGTWSVDVMNVSDKTISSTDIALAIRDSSGTGSSSETLSSPLAPGQRATLKAGGGSGAGSVEPGGMEMVLFVESTELPGCTFKPAQAWPPFGTPRE